MLYKDGKLFGLINIIDLAIVLVIIAAVIILMPNFIGRSNSVSPTSSGQAKTVYFTIEFPQTSKNVADNVTIGSKLNDNVRNYYYGEVIETYSKPAVKIIPNLYEGVYEKADVPGDLDVYIKVKANGTENDMEILAEGQPIKLGKQMIVKGKGYAGAGFVVELYTE